MSAKKQPRIYSMSERAANILTKLFKIEPTHANAMGKAQILLSKLEGEYCTELLITVLKVFLEKTNWSIRCSQCNEPVTLCWRPKPYETYRTGGQVSITHKTVQRSGREWIHRNFTIRLPFLRLMQLGECLASNPDEPDISLDLIGELEYDPIEDFITKEFLAFLFEKAMKFLDKRERIIIRGWLKLDDNLPASGREIAPTLARKDGSNKTGVTRQRVEQVQDRALQKLQDVLLYVLHKEGISLKEI